MDRPTSSLLLASLVACACATLAEGGGGDDHLPNALAGPFRPLRDPEIGNLRSEPYAIDDDERFLRDPSVIDADGVATTLAVIGYFAGREEPATGEPDPTLEPDRIFASIAIDGRTFDRDPKVVLAADVSWEGGRVGQPSALRLEENATVALFYAAEGGVGLATSLDGGTFTKRDQAVLAPDPSGWEGGGPLSSPGAARRPDGTIDLFYEVELASGERAIGLSRSSDDGESFTREGGAPALSAAGDEISVGTPFPVLATSATGRALQRLYYDAELADGRREIRLAAREGFDGPFVRAIAPVFGAGSKLDPREPCVVAFDGFALLFVTQKAGSTSALDYPAIAAGLAPATSLLPPADPP